MDKEKVKYPRPSILSDPYNDFSFDELYRILSKEDSELIDVDFMMIFQSYCPAGKYNECVYFLPYAINYIVTNRLNNSDVCYHLLHWISDNMEFLLNDGLFYMVQEELSGYFVQLFNHFDINNGYPCNIDTIIVMLSVWNNIDNYNLLGDRLLEKTLCPFSTYHQASWTCYLIYEYYTSYDKDNLSPLIASWSLDEGFKSHIYTTVLNSIIDNDDLLFFWEKIMNKCGML